MHTFGDEGEMKVDVVLASGKKGSGKTSLMDAFIKTVKSKHSDWAVVNMIFAHTIYEMHDAVREIAVEKGLEIPEHSKVKDRKLLQFLGTNWGREEFGENVWVNCLKADLPAVIRKHAKGGYNRLTIFISDTRFENEFDAFPEALRLRLDCPEEIRKARADAWGDSNHPSELGLDNFADLGVFDAKFNTQEIPAVTLADLVYCILSHRDWRKERDPKKFATAGATV